VRRHLGFSTALYAEPFTTVTRPLRFLVTLYHRSHFTRIAGSARA